MDKFNKSQNKVLAEEGSEESLEDEKSLIKSKKKIENSSRNLALINNQGNKNKTIISRSSRIFIIFYIIFILITYCTFPYGFYFLYNLSNKSISYSTFFLKLYDFHANILDLFNIYREFLFDNQSIIENMTPFDSLKRLEEISYDIITEEFRIVNVFLSDG